MRFWSWIARSPAARAASIIGGFASHAASSTTDKSRLGLGPDVAGGQRGAHRVVADVLEQPAHQLRPPRGRKVGFGGDPVGAIGQLIEHRSECFDQYGLEVGGRPALALGDARRELLHHEQPETVVVAREPVEVVADLGQRARQAVRNPAARVWARRRGIRPRWLVRQPRSMTPTKNRWRWVTPIDAS